MGVTVGPQLSTIFSQCLFPLIIIIIIIIIMNICSFTHFIIIAASFSFSFYTIIRVVTFLSCTNTTKTNSDYFGFLNNILLILLFTCQHSLMKLFPISSILNNPSLSYLDWTCYSIIIWSLDVSSSNLLWWLFTLIHSIAWYLIYCSTIMLDLPELLGIRQIVEHCTNKEFTCEQSLLRLYSHMRHPSFSSLSPILLARPIMTLDRGILATIFCTYMYSFWCPDITDLSYQIKQWAKKKRLLDTF